MDAAGKSVAKDPVTQAWRLVNDLPPAVRKLVVETLPSFALRAKLTQEVKGLKLQNINIEALK